MLLPLLEPASSDNPRYLSRTGTTPAPFDGYIGRHDCTWNRSYGIPQYNPERGVVEECDMCCGGLLGGHEPACVKAWHENAIQADISDIAGQRRELVQQRARRHNSFHIFCCENKALGGQIPQKPHGRLLPMDQETITLPEDAFLKFEPSTRKDSGIRPDLPVSTKYRTTLWAGGSVRNLTSFGKNQHPPTRNAQKHLICVTATSAGGAPQHRTRKNTWFASPSHHPAASGNWLRFAKSGTPCTGTRKNTWFASPPHHPAASGNWLRFATASTLCTGTRKNTRFASPSHRPAASGNWLRFAKSGTPCTGTRKNTWFASPPHHPAASGNWLRSATAGTPCTGTRKNTWFASPPHHPASPEIDFLRNYFSGSLFTSPCRRKLDPRFLPGRTRFFISWGEVSSIHSRFASQKPACVPACGVAPNYQTNLPMFSLYVKQPLSANLYPALSGS